MDIELVIKIPEEDYERVKKKFQMRMNIMANAIAHGKPLPKGHGRLIDADAYVEKYGCCGYLEDIDIDYFNTVIPTIVEADK